jgi:hypothetical protein
MAAGSTQAVQRTVSSELRAFQGSSASTVSAAGRFSNRSSGKRHTRAMGAGFELFVLCKDGSRWGARIRFSLD